MRASMHPRREVPVGDVALGIPAGPEFGPVLTGAVLTPRAAPVPFARERHREAPSCGGDEQ